MNRFLIGAGVVTLVVALWFGARKLVAWLNELDLRSLKAKNAAHDENLRRVLVQRLEAAEASPVGSRLAKLNAQFSVDDYSYDGRSMYDKHGLKARYDAIETAEKIVANDSYYRDTVQHLIRAWQIAAFSEYVLPQLEAAIALIEGWSKFMQPNRASLQAQLNFDFEDAKLKLEAAVTKRYATLITEAPSVSAKFFELKTLLEKITQANKLGLIRSKPYPRDWNSWVASYREAPTFSEFSGIINYENLPPNLWLMRAAEALVARNVLDGLIIIATCSVAKAGLIRSELSLLLRDLAVMVAEERQRIGWQVHAAPAAGIEVTSD